MFPQSPCLLICSGLQQLNGIDIFLALMLSSGGPRPEAAVTVKHLRMKQELRDVLELVCLLALGWDGVKAPSAGLLPSLLLIACGGCTEIRPWTRARACCECYCPLARGLCTKQQLQPRGLRKQLRPKAPQHGRKHVPGISQRH